jgi:lysozyme
MNLSDIVSAILSIFKKPTASQPPVAVEPTPAPAPIPVVNEPAPVPSEAEYITLCRPITKHFESCQLIAYCDPASKMGKALQADGLWYKYLADRKYGDLAKYANLDPKPWTCGWGETQGVTKTTVFTQTQADDYLTTRLQYFGNVVDREVIVPLLPHQKAGIVDWTYNEGEGRLSGSTMLEKLNANDFEAAMVELLKWNIAGGKVNAGLQSRRNADKSMFETGKWQP